MTTPTTPTLRQTLEGNDLRNPLAKARDQFVADNPSMFDADTLGRNAADFYLRNRLESAFIAGWHAREKEKPNV